MKIRVYKGKKKEYVPDILFEDGTYQNEQEYVERMRAMDERVKKALVETKKIKKRY